MNRNKLRFDVLALTALILASLSASLPALLARAEDARDLPEDPLTKEEFIAAGWPADYAEKLAGLKAKHPSWTFEKLDVTGLSDGKYTWNYILRMECDEEPRRNLVQSTDTYIPLRDMREANLYDSGWYRASKYTVSYFMDSRNFLDEEQIFQFYDLGWSDVVTVDMVKTVLRGTFMENAKLDGEYSDVTYADFFMEAGRRSGANPVYLAVLVRNEQGVAGNSYLISGLVGDRLWYYYSNRITGSENGKLINAPTSGWTEEELKKYNGYYNYFNIGAGGTGYFQIYLGGVKEAMNGTPELASEWGGDPSWNTRWKAILGGAMRATSKYVNDYQNTFYLQKFNVDPRSKRNFWGQYMQSIFGSYGRASSMYKSYKEGGVLDMPYNFIIPVFEGMPDGACAYPDGTEPANPSPITSQNVASYEILDLASVKSRFAKNSYQTAKIGWRCLVAGNGDAVNLGNIDLSVWSGVIIEYSVAEKFDSFAGNKKAVFALVSGDSVAADDTGNPLFLAQGRIADGVSGGYLLRRNVTVDLSKTGYSGNVYLTASMADGQKYVIHNIIFIAKKGYVPPPASTPEPETDTADSEPVTETEAEESSSGAEETVSSGCRASAGLPAALFAGAAAVLSGKRRGKKRNGN